MRIFIAIVVLFLSSFSVNAGGDVIRKGLPVNGIDRAFELAAVSMSATTVIFNRKCGPDYNAAYCRYDGAGPIEIRALGAAEDADAKSISITYTPDGKPKDFVWNVGLLVAVCEPDMPQKERGKIVLEIVNKVAGKGGLIEGPTCDYSAINLGAFMVTAGPNTD